MDDLPDNEALIQVRYSSLNYKDALSASGHKGITRKFPPTAGVDAAGVVVSDKTGQWKAGEQVVVCGLGSRHEYSGRLCRVHQRTCQLAHYLGCRPDIERGHGIWHRWSTSQGNGPVRVTGATGGVASTDAGRKDRERVFGRLAGPWKLRDLESIVKVSSLDNLPGHIGRMLAGRKGRRIVMTLPPMMAAQLLKEGFTLLTNAAEVKTPSPGVSALHEKSQQIWIEKGLSKTAEILPERATTQIALTRYSKSTGMKKKAFSQEKEAEAWLDSED